MKKLLLSLLCAAASLTAAADSYTGTVTSSHKLSANTTSVTLGEVTWNLDVEWYASAYMQRDGSPDRFTFGSANNPLKKLNFNTAYFKGKTVSTVKVSTRQQGQNAKTSFYVQIGNTKSEVYDLSSVTSGNPKEYTITFTSPVAVAGNLEIIWENSNSTTGSKNGGCTFSQIVVEYTEGTTPGKTPVTLSWTPESDNLDFGAEFTAPIFSCSDDKAHNSVVFQSSNTDLLDYVDSEWKFTPNVSGTAVITASIPEDNATYSATPATYTLTVTPRPVLGAITVNGTEVAENATITTIVNTPVTFASENAELMVITIMNGNTDIVLDEEYVEGSTYTWTPTVADTYIVDITTSGCDDEKKISFDIEVAEKPTAVEPTGLWKRVMSLNDINDYTAYMLAGYKNSADTWHAMNSKFTGKNIPAATVDTYENLLVSDETVNGEINILKSGNYYNFYMINAVISETTGGYISCNGKGNNNYSTVLSEKNPNGASDLNLTMAEDGAVTAKFLASTEDTSTSQSTRTIFSFNDSNVMFSCYDGKQKAFYIYEPVTEAIEGVLTENGEPVSYDEAINLKLNEPRTLHLNLAPKHSGYWKFVEGNNTKEVKALAAEHTPAEGYNQYVHENGITLTEAGTLYHYTHFNGKVTAEKALTVTGSTTGITEVEAEGSGEAEWFDLTGRRVAKPAKGGIFIIKQGSKTSKRAF